jgi:hypothetical protein
VQRLEGKGLGLRQMPIGNRRGAWHRR